MSGPSWTLGSLPDESENTVPALDHGPLIQFSGDTWQSHGHSITAQDLQALDSDSWLNVPQGSVESGLSPVLSHESQSTYTLNSLPDSDLPLLPSGLDLSFVSEPSWDVSGHVVYSSSYMPQDLPSSVMVSPQDFSSGFQSGPYSQGYSAMQPMVCGVQQPMFYPHGFLQPRRSVPEISLPQPRPLLPRMEPQSVSSSASAHAKDDRRSAQHNPLSAVRVNDVVKVSSTHNTPEKVNSHSAAAMNQAYPAVHSVRMSAQCVSPVSRHESASLDLALASTHLPDYTGEGNSGLPSYEQECEPYVDNASYSLGRASVPSPSTARSNGTFPPMLAEPDQEYGHARQSGSSGLTSTSGESDEGRHRNHPLYSKGPQPDGLYHCPFKSDPSCQHKPTKLKCNYDKFVDSHLKPFRCKFEACAKQEFSSTACLLRHEREAHGLHGHGERPHLCFYPGCERGMPGNGFPRRYNLFDHMKRVHDHKEDPTITGHDQGKRNANGRKRKSHSSASNDEQRPTQRSKLHLLSQAPSAVAGDPVRSKALAPQQGTSSYPDLLPASGGLQPEHVAEQQQQDLQAPWNNNNNNKPELFDFQLQNMGGPPDEGAHLLQRPGQNMGTFGGLSQQTTRYG